MDRIQEFAEQFKKRLIQWKATYKEVDFVPDVATDVFCPLIEDIKRLQVDNLKYIIVGDNPGETEREQQLYCVGRTKYIRMFFECILGQGWQKMLFLNKTTIFSKETDDLKTNNTEALEETQRGMANLILALHRDLKKCQLWILGYSQLEKGIFKVFGEHLNAVSEEQKERICLLKHPSYKGMAHDILDTINKYKSIKGKSK